MVSGLGIKTLQILLNEFETVENLFKAEPEEIVKKTKISPVLAKRIHEAQDVQSYNMEKRLIGEAGDIRVLCMESSDYPTRLQHISSPPIILYWQGALKSIETTCIAFVGSRACTSYGKKHTRRLITELAQISPDIIIVSGLARGIDTVAHETALDVGLKTVAVLGGGLNHIYPPENSSLAEAIKSEGALVSEFPVGSKPLGRNFPIRNRIISGMSDGVVLTESMKKSGAKITAAFALEQNREVFALPGSVDSRASEGPNYLISQHHAKLITSAFDIVEELQPSLNKSRQIELPLRFDEQQILKSDNFSEVHWKTLNAIGEGKEEIDSIHICTEIEIELLLGTLVELELMGIIQNVAGHKYLLSHDVQLSKS